jgi:hypothetical protein
MFANQRYRLSFQSVITSAKAGLLAVPMTKMAAIKPDFIDMDLLLVRGAVQAGF